MFRFVSTLITRWFGDPSADQHTIADLRERLAVESTKRAELERLAERLKEALSSAHENGHRLSELLSSSVEVVLLSKEQAELSDARANAAERELHGYKLLFSDQPSYRSDVDVPRPSGPKIAQIAQIHSRRLAH